MRKRIYAFIIIAIMALCFTACGGGGQLSAAFNDDLPTKIVIGEMIDFNECIDYTEKASVSIKYSTPTMSDVETDSMYFQTEELGEHDFTLNFSVGNKTKTLKCTIEVVPPTPSVVEADSSVYCTTGETIYFDALLTRSGIRITPARYSDTTFNKVEYANEVISVEDYSKQIETYEFASGDKSYTFEKAGSYTFYITVINASGSVNAEISASVLDEAGDYPIDNVTSSGVLYGENNDVKIMQGSASELSYIASNEKYSVGIGEYLKTELVFKGRNAPQIIFFTDEINGDPALGNGVGVTLEGVTPATAMSVYGPTKFSATTALVTRNNSFGRETLKIGKYYKWQVIITRISDKKLAVKSILFTIENGEESETARFDWASFEYGNQSNGYVEYVGSAKYGDVIFRYSEPQKCDKDGNVL